MAQEELTLFQEVDNLIELYRDMLVCMAYRLNRDDDDDELFTLDNSYFPLVGYQQEELPMDVALITYPSVLEKIEEKETPIIYRVKYKAKFLVGQLERMLISANKETRDFIFHRIFRDLTISPFRPVNIFTKEPINFDPVSISLIDFNLENCTLLHAYAIICKDIGEFFYNVKLLCAECGDDVYKYCKGNVDLTFDEGQERYFLQKYNTLQQQTQPYPTLKPTHRRAVLSQLLTRLGFDAETDKTARAKFIEAVVGGNIEAKPKDSASYKKPTKDALEAAEEWLKLIGVDENYRKRTLK